MTEFEPYLLPCPPRTPDSYRVSYEWEAAGLDKPSEPLSNNPNFAPRILMEPNGDLLFSYVNISDFTTFMSSGQSLRCRTIDRFGSSVLGPPIYFDVTSPGKTVEEI